MVKRAPEVVVVDVVVGRAKRNVVRALGVELDAAHVGFALDRRHSLLHVHLI